MSAQNDGSEDRYYVDQRIGRKPLPGDDDVNPWTYYGTIALVILLGVGVAVSLFMA